MMILEILSMVASIGSFVIAVVALKKVASINKLVVNLKTNQSSIYSPEGSPSTKQTVKGVKASGAVEIAAGDIKHE